MASRITHCIVLFPCLDSENVLGIRSLKVEHVKCVWTWVFFGAIQMATTARKNRIILMVCFECSWRFWATFEVFVGKERAGWMNVCMDGQREATIKHESCEI